MADGELTLLLSKTLVCALALLGVGFIWLIYHFIIRFRRLFSYPKDSIKSNRATRKTLRRIYFRPISCFARVANVKWQVDTISGRLLARPNGVSFWSIDYVHKYFFPYLGLGDKAFNLIINKQIKSADCLIDFGAIYPYRFYLNDGKVVDLIEEYNIVKQLTPVKRLGYLKKLVNLSLLCICVFIGLSILYIPLLDYLLSNRYPSYYYWITLLTLDLLIIFRPWLLFTKKKAVYSLKEFTEKSNLVSSNFELNNYPNINEIHKLITASGDPERLFFRDSHGLVSNDSYIEFDKEWRFIAFTAAMGMTLITLMSLVLIIDFPLLVILQIGLYIGAWLIGIKG